MSDTINEQLSAFADDELSRREFPLLWQRIAADPELCARWARYHLAGDALRGELPAELQPGLAGAVSRALAGETAPAAARAWGRHLASVAAALAVAVVALSTLQVEPTADSDEAIVVPVTAAPQVDPSRFATASGFQWESARPDVQTELDRYLLNHADQAERIPEAETPDDEAGR
jgi:sigma-E factor negative regulatory protein RseA